jgi:hypothetical protein
MINYFRHTKRRQQDNHFQSSSGRNEKLTFLVILADLPPLVVERLDFYISQENNTLAYCSEELKLVGLSEQQSMVDSHYVLFLRVPSFSRWYKRSQRGVYPAPEFV